MITYGRQSISLEDIECVSQALSSDLITTGRVVDEFEKQLSEYVKARTIVVSSGTAALHCAYKAAGIGPCDEVITPPNTFIATQATAALLGAKIVFADIDPRTGLILADSIAEKVTPRTKAVVMVDYAGQSCDVDRIKSVIKDKEIVLIQDAAHSLGSKYKGNPVGSVADITTFSFFPTKNITTGEGGAISSNNEVFLARAKSFARQGIIRDEKLFTENLRGPWVYEIQEFGLNYRLTDFQCALGISQLARLNSFKEKRRKIWKKYHDGMSQIAEVDLIYEHNYSDAVWHLFPILVPAPLRDRLFSFLRIKGVGVQVNYIPTISQPVFRNLGYDSGSCPNALEFYEREISLPIHAELSLKDVDFICELIVNFFKKEMTE